MDTHDGFQRVRSLLESRGLLPKRAFGQNVLVDQGTIAAIVGHFDIASYDTVVEIGPGLGALTLPLAQRARKLVAVEADRDMAQILAVLLKDDANATVVN